MHLALLEAVGGAAEGGEEGAPKGIDFDHFLGLLKEGDEVLDHFDDRWVEWGEVGRGQWSVRGVGWSEVGRGQGVGWGGAGRCCARVGWGGAWARVG